MKGDANEVGEVPVVMDLPVGQLLYDQGQGLQRLKDLNATLALAVFDDDGAVLRRRSIDPFTNLIEVESCEGIAAEFITWRIVSCQVTICIYGKLRDFSSMPLLR